MDIVNHITEGFLMGYIPTQNIYVGIASGIVAGIPDYMVFRKDNAILYDKIHNFRHWLSFIPPITLHVALDKLGHGINKRWYSGKWYEYFFKWREAMYLEVITWIINIILLIIIFLT